MSRKEAFSFKPFSMKKPQQLSINQLLHPQLSYSRRKLIATTLWKLQSLAHQALRVVEELFAVIFPQALSKLPFRPLAQPQH